MRQFSRRSSLRPLASPEPSEASPHPSFSLGLQAVDDMVGVVLNSHNASSAKIKAMGKKRDEAEGCRWRLVHRGKGDRPLLILTLKPPKPSPPPASEGNRREEDAPPEYTLPHQRYIEKVVNADWRSLEKTNYPFDYNTAMLLAGV